MLSIPQELIRHRVMILSLWLRIRGEMQHRRVIDRVNVPLLVVDKCRIIRSELWLECTVGIDIGGFALLVQKHILSTFDVEAE